jgi:hypothetical protein
MFSSPIKNKFKKNYNLAACGRDVAVLVPFIRSFFLILEFNPD